jgi:addiction module RelE/StbE family toxin
MSVKHIRWTLRALRRLDEIGAHIQKDNPDAAARVVARIVSAVDMLSDLPAAGRIGRIKGTREIVLADIPYIIPYRVGQDIEIITIMHAHQKWPLQLSLHPGFKNRLGGRMPGGSHVSCVARAGI